MSTKATPGARTRKLLSLALGTALLAGGSLNAAANDCVLADIDALPPLETGTVAGHAAALKLLQTADLATARVDILCSGGYLSGLELALAPGEQRRINLVAESGVLMPLEMGIDTSEAPTSGQWQIFLRALQVDQEGVLQARPFRTDEAHTTQLVQIEITADTSNQPGQQQRVRIGGREGVLLVIESVREEPLFRDQFRPDPTLGQFSHRTPSRSIPDRVHDPVGSSSTSH